MESGGYKSTTLSTSRCPDELRSTVSRERDRTCWRSFVGSMCLRESKNIDSLERTVIKSGLRVKGLLCFSGVSGLSSGWTDHLHDPGLGPEVPVCVVGRVEVKYSVLLETSLFGDSG